MANANQRYKNSEPDFARSALIPGIFAGTVLFASVLAPRTQWWTMILFIVSIFALIQLIFAYQAKQWWWIPLLAAIAVLWNPVFPITMPEYEYWQPLHAIGGLIFIISGWFIKIPVSE